jgi:hypothetical protein
MRGERIVIDNENAKPTPLDPVPPDAKNLVPRVLTKTRAFKKWSRKESQATRKGEE